MKKEKNVLYVLYANSFLDKKENKSKLELTQNKIDKFKEEIILLINDEKIIQGVMDEFEDFIVDYSEVEDIENFECYKAGWRDRENVENEINK